MPLDTGRRHRAIIRPVSLATGDDFRVKNRVMALRYRFSKLVIKMHKMDPLHSSSKRQAAALKGGTSRLKPKSTANSLAIKR
jgi:hypothetical protein